MDIQHAILQAKIAVGENDLVTAQKILKKVISQEPKNVVAWLILADVVQKPEIAEKCLQQVLKINPGNQEALRKLGIQQPATSGSESSKQDSPPAPEALDERFQRIAQPSMELDDPWAIPSQTSLPPKPSPPESASQPAPSQEIYSTQFQPGKPKKSGRWLEFSLIGVLCVMAVCVLGLLLFLPKDASGESPDASGDDAASTDNPVAVIFDNIRASNAESIPHYIATIHSQSPSYQSTKEMTKQAFGLFDLSYKISGVKITRQTKNEAVVAFTLTTQKIRGPSFRDNRITGDMILRKEAGRWKIYNQVVHDIKYLK